MFVLLNIFCTPCLQSSFDLGPSFMDEVLKALDEKEKQAEAAIFSASKGGKFEDSVFSDDRVDLGDKTPVAEKIPSFEDKGRLEEKVGEMDTVLHQAAPPPPLPTQPPRVVSKPVTLKWYFSLCGKKSIFCCLNPTKILNIYLA